MSKYYKVQNSTILYLNSSFNCIKSNSITIAKTSAGTGYTSAPTIVITPASGDAGINASATATITGGTINTITMTNGGSGYNTLPTITTTGGGNPGIITGFSGLVAGTNYNALTTTITATGGGGSGFSAKPTFTTTTFNISSSFAIVSGGTGYTTGQSLVFTGGGGSGAVATITATGGVITAITLTNAGSGYSSVPIVSVSGAGSGANITCYLTGTINGMNIINGGSNYTTTPTLVFNNVGSGTGASATPTINLGTPAQLTASFAKTYTYTWNNLPTININDLGRLSAINIVASNFNTTTIYTYRILGLQYTSRDTFFSDYGQPILSMAQNVNVCSYGSLGGNSFCIILTPQTINSISISVDDDITTKGSGQNATINFVIALEIEEFDPTTTEINNPYGESISNIKPMF